MNQSKLPKAASGLALIFIHQASTRAPLEVLASHLFPSFPSPSFLPSKI